MTTTTRAAIAACLFAAIVAGTLAPTMASAHAVQPANVADTHAPTAPSNVRVELHGEPYVAADGTKTYRAVRVSWERITFPLRRYARVFSYLSLCRHNEGSGTCSGTKPTKHSTPALSLSSRACSHKWIEF